MRIEGDCRWPLGVLGETGYRLCGKPALRAPYCEDCREEHQPYKAMDPVKNQRWFASVLRAADKA